MATAAKRRNQYETYGSVAYDPAYAPRREDRPESRPLVRPRERVSARPRAMVREAGSVSLFGIVGGVAVFVCAVLLLLCYVQLTTTGDSIVELRSELTTLEDTHKKLLAQYELAYDLKDIETAVTAEGTMVKPQSGQTVVLDLSEPDSLLRFDAPKENPGADALGGIAVAAENVLAYFR
ncbi:MAG: hypothetical protein RR606_06220 [Oscillospiraceae bacterium]